MILNDSVVGGVVRGLHLIYIYARVRREFSFVCVGVYVFPRPKSAYFCWRTCLRFSFAVQRYEDLVTLQRKNPKFCFFFIQRRQMAATQS